MKFIKHYTYYMVLASLAVHAIDLVIPSPISWILYIPICWAIPLCGESE
jgi:hypothetical protein